MLRSRFGPLTIIFTTHCLRAAFDRTPESWPIGTRKLVGCESVLTGGWYQYSITRTEVGFVAELVD